MEADHVGIVGNYEPFISSKDVTSEFSEVGEGNLETYCIADIGFTREDVWVYGSMSVSYAGLIDPEPEKEKAKAESKLSPTVITDKEGNSSSYSYDEKGNMKKQTYNKWNQVTSVTDALGNVTEYEYDKCNRLVKESDASGVVERYEYNAIGDIMKSTDANGETLIFYLIMKHGI